MAVDDTQLSTNVGVGEVTRSLGDALGRNWFGGWSAFPTNSSNPWTFQIVDLTHGLPIQPMTGATFAVSAVSLPLPSGAATAANQATEIASLASIDGKTPALGQALAAASVPVVLTAAQIATLTPLSSVSITGSVAVTGTFWQATQPVSVASLPLPIGASTEATLATLNGKVTACNTGAVTLSAALPAGSNLLGKVGIDQTTPGTTNAVQEIAGTTGGHSPSSFLSTAAVQATNVKASPGQIYGIEFFNLNAAAVYVRLYDKASTPGTGDTPIWRGIVPGNTAGAGFVKSWPQGIPCTLGIGFRCTGAIADNDATVLVANTVIGNIEYK